MVHVAGGARVRYERARRGVANLRRHLRRVAPAKVERTGEGAPGMRRCMNSGIPSCTEDCGAVRKLAKAMGYSHI